MRIRLPLFLLACAGSSMTAAAIDWPSARADRPPCIDGRIDDPVWRIAPPARDFVDFVPEPGRTPSQATEVRVAWDDDGLYFAFRCHDAHPERIRGRLAKRDAAFDDDWAGVILDPAAEARGALELMVNPRGCVMDAFVAPGGGGDDVAVDFDFSAGAVRDSAGWSAELAVPWTSLGGVAPGGMSCFALRQIRRTGERASWPAIDAGNPDWLRGAAELDLARAAAGPHAELLPALTLHRSDTRESGRWQPGSARPEIGLTASAAPRPCLALAVTLRPDFSHVEADAPQVSLNRRFPIVYPEKRAFFLEDRDLFDVAAEGGELAVVFHSREISAPIAGLRLAARPGRANRLGLLCAWDRPDGGESSRVLWVRGRHYAGRASYVGFCAGVRDVADATPVPAGARAGPEGIAGVAGIDADLVLGPGLSVSTHALRNVGSGSGGGHATAVRLDWSGALRAMNFAYQEIAPAFSAVTGVLRRCDVREGTIEGTQYLYPRLPGCARLTTRVDAAAASDFSGAPTDRCARLTVRLETIGPSAFQLSRTLGAEWCGGRRFAAGAWQVTAETAALRWLHLTFGGTFAATPIYAAVPVQGRSRATTTALTLQPSAWLSASWEETDLALWRMQSRARLSGARVRRARVELQPHRNLRLRAVVDEDGGPGNRLTDFLAELALGMGTTLQLGWGNAYEARDAGAGGGRSQEVARVAFLKAAYGLRLAAASRERG